MTGWLVYDHDNIQRNSFFIDRWLSAAQVHSVKLLLVKAQELAYGIQQGKPFLLYQSQPLRPDFVVMRAQHPLLSEHLEKMNIPCFNNAKVADVCNHKQKTHSLFSSILPMMPTAFLEASSFENPFPYPVVVKGSHGCGGRSVFLAKNDQEYQEAARLIAPDDFIVQPLCDEPGKDLRVYVLGKHIIATMLRHQSGDFRSNVGLGGGSHPAELTQELKAYVDEVMKQFDFGLAGIDFIFHQGKPVFNEIEDVVGTRMLYMHTQRDIAAEYLSYILDQIRL